MRMPSLGLAAVAVVATVALAGTSPPTGNEREEPRNAPKRGNAGTEKASHLSAYRAEPLAANVVDAESGERLEGVIVVAHWEVENPYGATVAQVMVMETTTDKQGKFAFPAWGPKRADISLAPASVAPSTGRLEYQAPALLLFKRDYMPQTLANPTSGFPLDKGPLRHSYWNGKTITLNPAGGDLRKYGEALAMFEDHLRFAFSLHDCSWRHLPRMLVAMDREAEHLTQAGIATRPTTTLDLADERNKPDAARCGSFSQFIRRYVR